jgi:hypothetical protein
MRVCEEEKCVHTGRAVAWDIVINSALKRSICVEVFSFFLMGAEFLDWIGDWYDMTDPIVLREREMHFEIVQEAVTLTCEKFGNSQTGKARWSVRSLRLTSNLNREPSTTIAVFRDI